MPDESAAPAQRPRVDWGLGRYESTAAKLLPAAELVVDHAEPLAGRRVVDVGCGTGNAALLAAARGAKVTGVDPAARLVEVARRRAVEEGVEAIFEQGEGASLPLADGEADVLISVFAVIFAPDAAAAAAEMARVTKPDGRIVLSAWLPEGAIAATARLFRETLARVRATKPAPPPFPWHDREALAALLEPHGFEIELEEASLSFSARSAREYTDEDMAEHPLRVAGRAVLEPHGEMQALHERTIEVLERFNEDPDAFRVTSRYVIAKATRHG